MTFISEIVIDSYWAIGNECFTSVGGVSSFFMRQDR